MYNNSSYNRFDEYSSMSFIDCLINIRDFHKIEILHLNGNIIENVCILINWGSIEEDEIK